jgi:antitoxin ChpS
VVHGGRLIVEPHPQPRYTLDELLAECAPNAPRRRKDRAWLDGKPRGREAI